METVKKSSSIDGLENVISHPCTICPLTKQSELPSPISSHTSKELFELVYCDIWGPTEFPLMMA